MADKLTDITMLIDRSGSMITIKDDMEGGLNNLIADQRKVEGRCNLTLCQFDDEYDVVYEGRDIAETPLYRLVPRGSTALLDALGRTIHRTKDRLAKMKTKPDYVIFVIVTDGHDNSSREFSKMVVNKLITELREKEQWNFVYLGANQDAIQEAGSIGIPMHTAASYAASGQRVNSTYQVTSHNIAQMRKTGGTMEFTPEQRNEMLTSGESQDEGGEQK